VSTPVVTNRAPAFGAQAGVGESTRFSIRGSGGSEILRSTIQFYMGSGPAFYEGDVLPEEHPNVDFRLVSPFPNPDGVAERTIAGDGSLKIVKGVGTLAAVYEFGGQQAPAEASDILMGEFRLKMAQADVTVDGNNFTGVVYGLKAGTTGIQIKFFSSGGSRWIEVQWAELTTIAAPGPAYVAAFDWDQGVAHTYKLLWDPKSDKLRLYVSSGELSDSPDTVLVDGHVSDFSGSLPSDQIPAFVPTAYFGHAYIVPRSTSYWYSAYLHNIVSHPVVNGIARGGHTGFIQTDNVIEYFPEKLPRKDDKPWTILPASFGTIEGFEEVSTDKKLVLLRTIKNRTFGFYRKEPSISLDAYTVLDFKVSGALQELEPSDGQASGIEIFIDDGTKKVVFALLSNVGTQYVGLLISTVANLLSSYNAQQVNWVNEATYRLIFRKNKATQLSRLVQTDEGVAEEFVASVAYSSLPATGYPGPSVGFLINGNTISSKVEARIGGIRYSTNVRRIDTTDLPLPVDGWEEIGTGSIEAEGSSIVIDNDVDTDSLLIGRLPSTLDSENGFFIETRGKVVSYEYGGEENPTRKVAGVGFGVDDGSYAHFLLFAEAGPPLGKIIFISTGTDPDENLLKIRAGDPTVDGTYALVDWTKFHMYRYEKTTGGLIRLFIDNAADPVIQKSTAEFHPGPTFGSGSLVAFGSTGVLQKAVSHWEYFSFGLSMGFDISAFPVLSSNEVLKRFNYAFNSIVEGANSV
jgi:hypothetical protein